jgi:hypothetical protein
MLRSGSSRCSQWSYCLALPPDAIRGLSAEHSIAAGLFQLIVSVHCVAAHLPLAVFGEDFMCMDEAAYL